MANTSQNIKVTLKELGFVHRGGHWWNRQRESVIVDRGCYMFYKNAIADGIIFNDINMLADFLKNGQ